MNIDSLTKILKMTGTNDSLKIRHQNDADTVNFQCEGSDDRLADFDLKLMQIESEHMEIPEQHYKVVARIPSAEFQKICRDLKEFGETIQISGSKEGLKFMVQGDLGSGNVVLKPREGEKPEEKVTLTVHEPVTATFALRYLVNFSKDWSHLSTSHHSSSQHEWASVQTCSKWNVGHMSVSFWIWYIVHTWKDEDCRNRCIANVWLQLHATPTKIHKGLLQFFTLFVFDTCL